MPEIQFKNGPDRNIYLKCTTCNEKTELIEDYKRGDLICSSCGLVVGDRIISAESEWRNFSDEKGNPSRVGMASDPILNNRLLDTSISADASNSLKRIHTRATATSDRQLIDGIMDIEIICHQMALPQRIIDMAKEYYKLVIDSKKFRGRKPQSVKGACIFLACRAQSVSREFSEIANVVRVDKFELGRFVQEMQRTVLKDRIELRPDADPAALMTRLCNELNLSSQVEHVAQSISKRARQVTDLSARKPRTIASGAIMLALELLGIEGVSLVDIANALDVSEQTISLSYRNLRDNFHLTVDQDLIDADKLKQNPVLPHHMRDNVSENDNESPGISRQDSKATISNAITNSTQSSVSGYKADGAAASSALKRKSVTKKAKLKRLRTYNDLLLKKIL
eukprot:NODE_19_length_47148_cov_1.447810.p10 type:complete len:396 gc:universal NODE_19_length_47148_cov_1.447810:1608-421(-)